MGKIIPDYFIKKEKEGKGEGRKRRNPSPDNVKQKRGHTDEHQNIYNIKCTNGIFFN